MDTTNTFAILSLAFGLGLLHALDADHIMAVSGLSARRPALRSSLQFCFRWAIGHGASILVIGGCVLLIGLSIPTTLSEYAEALVGFVLLGIGIWILWEMHVKHAHIHFHTHDDIPRHAHWHMHTDHQQHEQDVHRHRHSAVFVGILHGTAGSAPLLAILPLTRLEGSPWLGMGYLLIFSLGVLTAMILFGGLLGQAFNWLKTWGNQTVRIFRGAIAISSIVFGTTLIMKTFL